MRVKNQNMAGRKLRLRFSGEYATFDAAGVANVPEKDGKFLCATPGWTKVGGKGGKPAQAPAAAPPAPPAPPPAFTPPAPGEAAEGAPAAAPEPTREDEPTADFKTDPPPSDEADEGEGPDLDSMTKNQLYAAAESYGVELSYEQKRLTVAALRELLTSEIYDDAEEAEEASE